MIAVTGATGKLGQLVVEGLLGRLPASQIVAAVRSPEKAAALAARGVLIRKADYSLPASLPAALAGCQKLLLISSNEIGRRAEQHRAVVEAAKAVGLGQLVYTSVLRADVNTLGLAADHKATEAMILASGLPYTLLRNGWYIENYTENLAAALAHGALLGSAGEGRIRAASRADFAEAAVAVLTEEGHEYKTYELGGDQAFTMAELAAAVSAWAGRTIGYANVPPEEYQRVLLGAGLPAPMVELLVDSDLAITRGELDTPSGDLRRLIGRPTRSVQEVLASLPKP
jgi:NAD(P)H dehydrogenase (quinone)